VKLTNVPATILDPQLRVFLDQVSTILRTQLGGDGGTVVTRDELIEAGLVDPVTGNITLPEEYDPFGDLSLPPAPSGLAGTGAVDYILLAWDPRTAAQRNVSLVEIWRSDEDDVETAYVVGTASGAVFSDAVGPSSTFFYWIRAVSYAGTPSAWFSLAGLEVSTVINPAQVLALLEGSLTESQLYADLNTRLDKIEPTEATVIAQGQTVNALGGQWTVKIDNDGNVAGFGLASTAGDYDEEVHSTFAVNVDTFAVTHPGSTSAVFAVEDGRVVMDGASIQTATIKDAQIHSISADKLVAQSGTLAEAIIGEGHVTNLMIGDTIQSDNYVPGVSGWSIKK
jgi:hypothetical protein